jgi:hypothetical protein
MMAQMSVDPNLVPLAMRNSVDSSMASDLGSNGGKQTRRVDPDKERILNAYIEIVKSQRSIEKEEHSQTKIVIQ